jgi:hypothetical protein
MQAMIQSQTPSAVTGNEKLADARARKDDREIKLKHLYYYKITYTLVNELLVIIDEVIT